jgi:arylsulfatase A-like enzyme
MRGVLLLQGAVPVYLPGLMVVTDAAAAAALVIARPLLLPRRISIVLYAPLVALIYQAAGMHAELHGSLFRLAHILQALDGDFLAATLSWRSLAWYPLYLLLATAWLWALAVPHPTPPRRVRAALAIGLLLLAYFSLMPGLTHLAGNPLLSTMVQVPGAFWRAGEREAEPVLEVADAETDPVFFLRDQAGEPRGGRPNILVIMVEGLSGAYLPLVAAHHGVAPDIEVPGLDQLIRQHDFHLFPNAIAMQRQTHRGSYPILCGDYPRVTTGVPKMTLIANSGQPVTCLPRVLRDAGYQTAYLQAASLRFMRKDAFMPLAGFDTVMGRDEFAGLDDSAGGWGPEDGPFFLAALKRLKLLEAADAPWFATLLNVATHHPFVHEDEDPGEALLTRRQRSFQLLTAALDRLMTALAAAGMLDNTVVILTSDEAGGYRDQLSSTGLLHNNFGFMAVRMPDRGTWPPLAAADTLVAHMDVAVTVMDLLGLEAASNMIGSSMLHNPHRRPRGLLFGDTYGARTFFLYDYGELVACDETLLRCEDWRFDPQRLFGSLRLQETPPRLPVSARNRIVGEASLVRDKGAVTDDGTREAPTVITRRRPHLGKQALALAKDDVLEVTVEAQALPDDEQSAREGTLMVTLRNRETDASLAERSIIVQGGYPLLTKLQLPITDDAVTVDVDLHWQPGNPRDEVAIRALDLRRRPAASTLLPSPTAGL